MNVTKEKPLKVLQIVGGLGMGGAETWLMELLRLWSANGKLQMDFLITGGGVGVFDEEAKSLGSKLHYIQFGRTHLFQFIKRFRHLLKEEKYDAIHDHGDYSSGWHFLIGAGLLPPVRVTHVHNPWLHIEVNYNVSWQRTQTMLLGKMMVRKFATHVCGTSGEILRSYGFRAGDTRPQDVSVVHCGINVTVFNSPDSGQRTAVRQEFNWAHDSRIVLFAGRLDRNMEFNHPQNHKNSWLALNVLRIAVEKDKRIKLIMAGAGDKRSELEEAIASWGLSDSFRLVGIRRDIPRLMRAADILFFPSRQEGLGMVAVEAQAAGLPVLASTAVPKECVVIPQLYTALSLEEPLETWCRHLIEILAKPRLNRIHCGNLVNESAFSIQNSANSLEKIYSFRP